jgi:hypothetical protein
MTRRFLCFQQFENNEHVFQAKKVFINIFGQLKGLSQSLIVSQMDGISH